MYNMKESELLHFWYNQINVVSGVYTGNLQDQFVIGKKLTGG